MSAEVSVKLSPSWMNVIGDELDRPYMLELQQFLQLEKSQDKTIYPAEDLIFNALNTTSIDDVKVVILGQDPYHGPGQAHGLCFSVLPGVRVPPSLRNIFKELNSSLGFGIPEHGCLQSWAEQGVLLLNATLTVEHGLAGSHQKKGWEAFTDAVIQALNSECNNLVFLLWGNYAQRKGSIIDGDRHKVLRSAHPSPLSAHRGFMGCGHFQKANEYLEAQSLAPIDWSLPEA
ncbi:MAG: uracil-DNA glycosylase [Flavobacteriales bacterium]|jgi:uracil-DNA glycosylase